MPISAAWTAFLAATLAFVVIVMRDARVGAPSPVALPLALAAFGGSLAALGVVADGGQ